MGPTRLLREILGEVRARRHVHVIETSDWSDPSAQTASAELLTTQFPASAQPQSSPLWIIAHSSAKPNITAGMNQTISRIDHRFMAWLPRFFRRFSLTASSPPAVRRERLRGLLPFREFATLRSFEILR